MAFLGCSVQALECIICSSYPSKIEDSWWLCHWCCSSSCVRQSSAYCCHCTVFANFQEMFKNHLLNQ